MHPLERLLNLVILLLETPRSLTFDQIRERLPAYAQGDDESAKRMFERDKDILRDLGVPVEVGSTDAWEVEQGYRIPKERYYLPDIEFTEEEISALFVAAQTPGTEEQDAGEAVRKLQSGVEPSVLARMSGGPVVAGADAPPGRLRAVTEAIESRRSLSFDYRAASGEIATRHVDPYSLVWRRGRWYVVGLDRDRDEIRSFRLDRFRSDPKTGGEASAPPEGFDGRDHLRTGPWTPPEDAVDVRMAFSPDVAWWIVPSLVNPSVERTRDDGWLEVSLPAEPGESFTAWVLSFGADAVVLSPDEVRDDVMARLDAAASGRG
jgi:proteasome accessory factor B